jgi:hypothetical protein
MKKVLLVLAVAAIGMVSCKKEEVVAPSKVTNSQMAGGDKSILLGMD